MIDNEKLVNRKYKDDIFRYIFKNPDEFVGLYKALTGNTLNADELEFYDLDSVVIKDWKNDVSFVTKDNKAIILMEAQSTPCANMAVRCLVYYAELIKKRCGNTTEFGRRVYSSKRMYLPAPEFIVAYNGKKELEYSVDELKKHFQKENENINLTVSFVDIKYDKLREVRVAKEASESLMGYSFFVEQMRHYRSDEGMNISGALSKALEDCRSSGYLLNYLDRKEFIDMVETSITFEEYTEILKENALEEGMEKGMEKGMAEGREKERRNNIQNMYKNGFSVESINKILGIGVDEIKAAVKEFDSSSELKATKASIVLQLNDTREQGPSSKSDIKRNNDGMDK